MVQEECNPAQEDLDEEPEQQPPRRYSYKELSEAMEVVEGFFLYQNGKEAEEMQLNSLKMQSWTIRHPPKSSQTSLDNFVVKHN